MCGWRTINKRGSPGSLSSGNLLELPFAIGKIGGNYFVIRGISPTNPDSIDAKTGEELE
jgi:hypothetical protein